MGLRRCLGGLCRAGRGLWILPECNDGKSLKVFTQKSDIIKVSCKRTAQADVRDRSHEPAGRMIVRMAGSYPFKCLHLLSTSLLFTHIRSPPHSVFLYRYNLFHK